MARISTYPIDTAISGGDKWIGSDAQFGNATKNFTVNKVAEFLNSANKIQSDSLRFRYQDWQTGDLRENGTISFTSPQPFPYTSFASISGFLLSEYEYGSALPIKDYYSNPLTGAYVLITQTDNKNNWGIFLWDSSVVNALEPTFYDIGLTWVSSNGNLNNGKDYFISLLQLTSIGPTPVSDKNFVYSQAVPSSVWVVSHNLNKYASVTVVDSAGTTVYGEVEYNSLNQCTLRFKAPFSGEAFFN